MRISYLNSDVCSSDLAAPSSEAFEERAFYEYHLYDLPRPTTIRHNQTKQIRLLEANSVPTERVYLLAGAPWYYTQQRSEEHTSELQSLMRNSYAVFCLKKKTSNNTEHQH